MTAPKSTRPLPPKSARPLPPKPGTGDEKPAPRVLPEVAGGIVRFTQEPAEERAARRSVLFTIDDDEYTVLDNPGADLGLQYLDVARKLGPYAATSWAMETMLGREAYIALQNCKGLSPKGLQRVIEVVITKLVGSLDGPKED